MKRNLDGTLGVEHITDTGRELGTMSEDGYTYYLLHLSDGTSVTVPALPDFESWTPVEADDLRSVADGGSVDAKTMHIVPRHVVSYEVK